MATHLGRPHRTVKKYLQASTFPARPPRRRRASILAPYKAYLRERWNAGGHRARARCREMQAQGLPGQSSMVADSVSRLRPVHGRLSTHRTAGSPATSAAVAKPLTPRRAPWLVRRREAKRTDAAQDQRARRQAPEGEIAAAIGWTQDFADLVRQRQPAHLETWLERATARCLQAFKSLAKG